MAAGGNISQDYTILKIGDLIHLEWTAMLFVFGMFLFVAFMLNRLLFQPVLTASTKQRDFIDRRLKDAEKARKELDEAKSNYEQKRSEVISEIEAFRERSLSEAREKASKSVAKAREKSTELLNKGSEEIEEMLQDGIEQAKTKVVEIKQSVLKSIYI